MKNKLEREICDRLTVIERKIENALSRQLKEQKKKGMTREEYNKFFNPLSEQKEEEKIIPASEKYDERFLDKVKIKVIAIHFQMSEEKVMGTEKFDNLVGELIDLILE